MSTPLYLERYAWKTPLFPDYQPEESLRIIIVIPSFKEKDLLKAIDSLSRCHPPGSKVLIIVLVNEPKRAPKEVIEINEKSLEELAQYQSTYEILYHHIKLPAKKAGVGLARKIGMDEAVRMLEQINVDGIIVCYDADCSCESNYLIEIEKVFDKPQTNAGVIFYEHQLDGLNQKEIIEYETYLRYYIDALRFAGFPYAHQTLGSCIIVRSSVYQKQGGMNTRKAGEDFYFLNKVIPLGGFVEINSTTVYPSDRVSDRVPFGTGKAVNDLLMSDEAYQVYNPQSFEDLKAFFDQVEPIWKEEEIQIPETIQSFLGENWLQQLKEVRSQTASFDTFINRFFKWFDAFKILKFMHYARDQFYPSIPLEPGTKWLSEKFGMDLSEDPIERLLQLRENDRNHDLKPNRKGSSHQ